MKIRTDRMLAAADEASILLKALANRRRLVIVCQLLEKERSVGELAALLKARDSTVSQHLALLRKDGLVTARRDAQTIWYSIASDAARQVVDALYRAYCAPASVCAPKPNKSAKAAKPRAAGSTSPRRSSLEPNQ
ncbi:MAG: metalloregulator ArsR/SmtB family transcription factor [Pseudolabrys sp.]|jgi:DNA-binding transcriptional ArsR family regulator